MDDSILDEYRDSINDYFDDDLETSISNNGEKMLQKIKLYDNCLPYCEQLELIRVKYLDYLKRNLCHSMLSDNNGYLFLKWMDEFSSYISIYDLAFNKAEHIFLTKLLYNSLTFFQYDYQISKKLMELLSKLLKERRLISRSELELDWHVLYAFHKNFDDPIHKSSNGNLVKNAQKKELIRLTVHARAYFSKDSTKEMLNEWKQYLCVHAKKYKQYLDYFSLFLPTLLPPEEFEFGFKLWFDDFIDMLNWFQVPPTSLLNLLTRLAEDVHGYIDWEPYLPYFFQKLSPKLTPSIQFNIFYYLKLLTWIISPNNIEKNIYYAKKLLLIAKNSRTRFLSKPSSFVSCHLAMLIVQRYKKEQRNLWYNYTPNNYKLDDKTFNEFGAILLENFIDSYFYGTQSQLSYEQLYAIVNLNPELIAEKIPEKLQIAYDQISEPWRLEAILKLYSVSIFPIILDNKIGPKYRIELIPMLFQLIELFNPYDHNLCLIQLFAIKSILILEFPLIDCSSLCNSSDKILTEYETEMCLQSIRLEEFPICFMRCCQNMIDSNNEHLFDNLKKSDSLAIIMFSILTRTTETIAKSFIDNFISFIVSNIYEDGYIVIKIIMESIAMIYPEYMMKKLFPLISEHLNILVLNRDTKLSTCLEKDLRYHIEIFRNLFYCNSELLSNYQDEILILIEKISNLKINSQYFMVYCLLSDLFDNLFTEKIAIDLQKIEPKMMIFENWPKLITTKKFSVKWYQTTTNVLNFAHHLIEIFIKNKLILLEDWIESKSTMTNDELLKNLRLISSVNGLIIDSPKFLSFSLDNSTLYSSNMKNPLLNDLINLNEHIINVINKVLIKLETIKSGDTQSYEEIIYIYCQISKKSSRFQCKKIPKKRLYQCRNKLNEYVWLVHFYSVMIRDASIRINLINTLQKRQNETDICIMKNLLLLSQSNYPTVRYDAEKTFGKIFSHHLDSSKFISDELIDKLNTKDADSLIGVLHLLHCNSDRSLMFCSSWNTLLKLYPILVRINLSEKLEIIDIFDVDFFLLFTDHKFMIPLEKNHSLELLSGYFEEGKSLFFQSITEKEIEDFRQKIIDSNQNNRITYLKLVEQLLTVMRDENLHWRFYHFGFLLLNNLIRNDIDFPLNGIEFLIRNLTHDLQRVRKIAQEVLVKIMYIMLPKKITIKIENLKSIDYDLNCHQNEETYNRQLFLDENHYGY
uniref:Proteasome activator complex subunit 4-like n=1 Tax=Dermatophagoides pteronyssinus TaxID=6956 RepID=A0A6P6XV94_DERPT